MTKKNRRCPQCTLEGNFGICDRKDCSNNPEFETPEAPHVGALHTQDILDEKKRKDEHMRIHIKVLRKSMCAKDCGESTVTLMGHVVSMIEEELTLQQERHKEEMREVIEKMIDSLEGKMLNEGHHSLDDFYTRGLRIGRDIMKEQLDIINKKIQKL